jgi:hypothetical protein
MRPKIDKLQTSMATDGGFKLVSNADTNMTLLSASTIPWWMSPLKLTANARKEKMFFIHLIFGQTT